MDDSGNLLNAGHAGGRAPSFLLKWLRSPFKIGAIAASSKGLAREMAAQADLSLPGAVIELGGGTGAITRAILARGVGYDRLHTVEFDHELAATLRHRFPHLNVVEGDAGELVSLMAARGVDQAACVISGLPLLGMPATVQHRILKAAFSLIAPGGRFIQFTYGPTMPTRPSIVRDLGLKAHRAGHIMMNVPPARVWCYERAETH